MASIPTKALDLVYDFHDLTRSTRPTYLRWNPVCMDDDRRLLVIDGNVEGEVVEVVAVKIGDNALAVVPVQLAEGRRNSRAVF